MTLLTSRGEVHQFIGLVNYYRNIWATISHTLAPLTELMSSKVRFNWKKLNNRCLKKLSRLWPAIFYCPIQILIENLKLITMLEDSN